MLSRLALISGFKMIERRVIEAVWRDPRINSRTLVWIRGFEAKKGAFIAYLCLQQVRGTKNHCIQTVLKITGHLWTGRGLQLKPSRRWLLKKEGRHDISAARQIKITIF